MNYSHFIRKKANSSIEKPQFMAGIITSWKYMVERWNMRPKAYTTHQVYISAKIIWISHWCHMMADGAEFWISYQRLAFLSIFSRWQLIQNLAPSTILWRQCDIEIETF